MSDLVPQACPSAQSLAPIPRILGLEPAGVDDARPVPCVAAVTVQSIDPLSPQVLTGQLELKGGALRLELAPEQGGRVSRLRLGDTDILVGPSVHPDNWGSTYWTSPQDDWGWPPVAAIDSDPYEARLEGAVAVLTSQPALVGPKRVQVTKRFALRMDGGAVEVEYRLHNLGEKPISIASWEISRVPAGGLSFFVAGAREYTLLGPHGILPTVKRAAISWFDHRHFVSGRGAKLNADSLGGWLAHVVRGAPGRPNVLFLKLFDPVPLDRQAPGEGVVELYADETGSYVEVENQSACDRIEPGQVSTYRVTWLLRELSGDMEVSVGAPDLLRFVQRLVDGS